MLSNLQHPYFSGAFFFFNNFHHFQSKSYSSAQTVDSLGRYILFFKFNSCEILVTVLQSNTQFVRIQKTNSDLLIINYIKDSCKSVQVTRS
jgi:hypothetical protein